MASPLLILGSLLAVSVATAGCTRFAALAPRLARAPAASPAKASFTPVQAGPLGPGWHPVTLVVHGRDRSYLLHVPPTAGTAPRPLIIELHGGGGTAAGMERLTDLTAQTDPRGWLVAAPSGIGRRWNDGRSGIGSPVDDVAFIRALIDDVAVRTSLDRSRVFATGISNGAMMSGRLACDLSDRVAAVAQVAGTIGVDERARCTPSAPVSVLVIAGTADPLVPYGGGAVGARLGLSRGAVIGAEQYVADWLARDGLSAVDRRTSQLPPDTAIAEVGSMGGPQVAFYSVAGGGHTWPGGPQYLPRFLVGSTTHTFDASQVIVEFFAGTPARSAP
jgi:polyhydroxybutyrate depolymerase